MDLAYRILNVFTIPGQRLSGNPLCVVEDGRGLSDAQMQAVALQMNLSETTFILPPGRPGAAARVRIFTPEFEMPFAGHPTLGTAHVVRQLTGAADRVGLEMAAGLVAVRAAGDRWTLRAPREPAARAPAVPDDELAAMVGLPAGSVAGARWVDTGVEQLLLPLTAADLVRAACPDPLRLARDGRSPGGEAMAYLFAAASPGSEDVEARFFFLKGGGVVEDPATGSACANLGGWLLATGSATPAHRRIRQGAQAGRPSLLDLDVDGRGNVQVTGEVLELGRGTLRL